MVLIAAALLSADAAEYGAAIRQAEAAGADWIHLDVVDGHFAPVLTLGPAIVRKLRRHTDLPFDVHLMVQHPDRFVDAFAEAGADSITVHVEADHEIVASVSRIHAAGMRAGLALAPATPASALDPHLPGCELIVLMTVDPGPPGQAYQPGVLPKVAAVRERLGTAGPRLQVDGGINRENAAAVTAAGADVLVAGSAIFSGNIRENLAALRAAGEG